MNHFFFLSEVGILISGFGSMTCNIMTTNDEQNNTHAA